MKKILAALSLSLLLCANIGAQTAEKGIQFHHDNWEKVIAEAKASNKLIFLDAYTSWCGPCKWMAANIFTNDTAAQFYTKNFVNAKFDMEKGEGKTLAERYYVAMYPTFLFINGDGEVVHQACGSMPLLKFIALGELANDPNRQMKSLNERFTKGDRDPDFLYNLAYAKQDACASPRLYAETYLEVIKKEKWSESKARKVIMEMIESPDSEPFKYLTANRADFEKEFGVKTVATKIASVVSKQAFTLVQNNPKDGWERLEKLYKQYFDKDAPMMVAEFKMEYYQKIGDNMKTLEAMGDFTDKYAKDDWQRLNDVAWSFYENTDSENLLKKAAAWAEKSVKINSNYYNNDSAAAIYFKLKDKEKAKKFAQTAIEMAKKFGNSYEETTELLKKIETM
ncbi:MAG: hypothetical protein RI894_1145 [Bacteroidota bacterium]|jgi:thiol-disulfide isomerase/thioredoxin